MDKLARNDDMEPQTGNVKSGIESKKRGNGGTATSDRDTKGQVAQAKREHPEAPDPAIGMQDEKGH
ncbi:uncharacterized protein EI97DRAFT_430993 [Westerdykella ornata]|uniref:Uncharacterized protein n=1 Tax=Westerdykella ornata TaxID=318751 RepID=A0A6A6JQC7_WESOR|nr:uncharacterized protein EI97DRAFT_430993 [Westerdykella ornata]KAF2278742.1 hypothetical protein EI97DRAFT_430993 [Westerdykella ornata]